VAAARAPARETDNIGDGSRLEREVCAMGLFEQDPWLMVPLILLVVVAYDGFKFLLRKVVRGRLQDAISPWSRGRE
jgi:hypothetical protein